MYRKIIIDNIEIPLIPDYPAQPAGLNHAIDTDVHQHDSRAVAYAEVNETYNVYGFEFSTFGQKNPNSLGKGGTAEVFKTKLNNTDVALKRFKAAPNFFNPEYRDEKYTHEHLKHPNIIQLIGYIEIPDNFYALVLELAQMSLQNYLDQNKNELRDPAVCKQYAKDIIKGVEYLHSQSKIHRDLKPANVMIVGNTAKLADFGCTKDLYKSNIPGESFSLLNDKIATEGYMPPEAEAIQTFTAILVTTRYDIYSLSLILYLLTTKDQTKPVDNPKVPTAAPVQWQYLIHRGLNKKPEHRPLIKEFVDTVNDPNLELQGKKLGPN